MVSKSADMTLIEHLEELRSRIIKSLIFVIIAVFASIPLAGRVLKYLAMPVGNLIFISPQEAFVVNVKIAFFVGVILSLPFVLWQLWCFVSSGLDEKERKYIAIFAPLSLVFFIAGAVFCYFVMLPIGIDFLLSFSTEYLSPAITVNNYVSFVCTLMVGFGIAFELPLISLFLTRIGIITPKFLKEKRRHAIVAIFIVAAVLTPPDVVTQCLLAVPLMALYEIGIIFSKIAYSKKH